MNAIELKCRREALGLSRDALADTLGVAETVSYTHLTLPTNREV